MATSRTVASPSRISPQELVINITYRCPLRCSHCCFSSDMTFIAHLSAEEILAAIDDAARIDSVGRLDFVGGDPFLHPDIMERAFRHARSYGIGSAVVTSAFWATTEARALSLLTPLAAAGLERLTISYDDQHAEYLKESSVVHAYRAAKELGLEVKIAVVVGPDTRIDGAYIARLLGLPEGGGGQAHIYETFINSTGRALENISEEEMERRRASARGYKGPCLSMLRQFSVNPDGKVLACCGVIPYRDGLGIGELGKESLDTMIRNAYADPVMQWLAFEGPVAMLRQITAGTERPCVDDDFDGICNACDVLFGNPRNVELLHKALPGKMQSLNVQAAVLGALDIFTPPAPPIEREPIPAAGAEPAEASAGRIVL